MGQLDKAIDFLLAFLILALCSKYPSTFPVVLPILLLYPLQRLVMVSSYRPSPQLEEDYVVELGEHLLRGHISVIVRPTAYLGVEFANYIRAWLSAFCILLHVSTPQTSSDSSCSV